MNQDIMDIEEHEKKLMAFIKFIEEEISICTKDCDLDNLKPEQVREITDFISLVLDRIVNMISSLSELGERPTPADVRACLGQKARYGDIHLYDIVELIMNTQGYMHKPETFAEIQKINFVPDNLNESIEKLISKLNDEPNVQMRIHP